MSEKMKTIKIEPDVHRRLTIYKFQLQAQRGEPCTFGDAIDEALNAADALVSLKEKQK